MEEKKRRDLPETDLKPLGCEELNPVIAEVECLEEHFQMSEEDLQDIFWAEPTDQEIIDELRERYEIEDPFYGMCPSYFDEDEDCF